MDNYASICLGVPPDSPFGQVAKPNFQEAEKAQCCLPIAGQVDTQKTMEEYE